MHSSRLSTKRRNNTHSLIYGRTRQSIDSIYLPTGGFLSHRYPYSDFTPLLHALIILGDEAGGTPVLDGKQKMFDYSQTIDKSCVHYKDRFYRMKKISM